MKNKIFWEFQAKKDKKEADLLLYGVISSSTWWGDEITPKQFYQDLVALGDIEVLNIYINSPGGDVFAGQAIHSMISRHSAQKNVYIDGLAASAASFVAMAGDKIIMPKNAMIMIHNPMTGMYGNANDFRKLADDLDKVRESMLAIYEKTGQEQKQIVEWLDAETWFTADEAVKYGFATEVEEEKAVAACIKNECLFLNNIPMTHLDRYKNTPKEFRIAGKIEDPAVNHQLDIDDLQYFIFNTEKELILNELR